MSADQRRGVALWVGCYTSDMGGSGEGILALALDDDGGYAPLAPVTPVASPSFLALHPSQPVLYAVSEGAELVHAYRYDDSGALTELGAAGIASPLVCHVAVASDGAFLVVSCWGDGAVLVFELNTDGSLGARHTGPASDDPYGEARQSRAHSCLMLGGGRFVTADMGHDVLRCWSFSAAHGIDAHAGVTLPHGCGPRHFARTAAGNVYVNTEYSGEVLMLVPASESAEAPGAWLELHGSSPDSAGDARPGDAAAEICLDDDERHLYVGVRGSDVICRLVLGADGLPSPRDEITLAHGAWPRHQCIVGERLVVAFEHSHAVASYSLAADAVQHPQQPKLLSTGSPTCVLPAAR